MPNDNSVHVCIIECGAAAMIAMHVLPKIDELIHIKMQLIFQTHVK